MNPPPPIPRELEGRYRSVALLGQGGFGAVWRCLDLSLDRPVALKLLLIQDDEQLARFRREAAVAARVRHPGIVEVLDHGVTGDGEPYIVYSLVEGAPLSATEPPAASAAVDWACQGAGALTALHDEGLVHRDVTPGNVLLDHQGRLVLVDFGLARPTAAGATVTQAGLVIGTPSFMAPELWQGEPASAGSDQFAWAATLFQTLYATPCYGADEPAAILSRLGEGWSPRIPTQGRGRYRELEGPLLRALSMKPAERFPDLRAFARRLAPSPALRLEGRLAPKPWRRSRPEQPRRSRAVSRPG